MEDLILQVAHRNLKHLRDKGMLRSVGNKQIWILLFGYRKLWSKKMCEFLTLIKKPITQTEEVVVYTSVAARGTLQADCCISNQTHCAATKGVSEVCVHEFRP